LPKSQKREIPFCTFETGRAGLVFESSCSCIW